MYTDSCYDEDEPYVGSHSFLTRLILILILIPAWISAAAAGSGTLGADLNSTYIAFLVIALVAFVEAIAIFIASLVDFICEILFIILDALMAICLAVMSIAAIAREVQADGGVITNTNYRTGSLASAAIFGFIAVVLFILLILFYLKDLIGFGKKKSPFCCS